VSDAEKRLAMLETMIEKGSKDPFHHYARAMELRGLGRLDEALAAYAGVRERFPGYVPTYLMAGQVAVELGKDDEARTWLERGLEVARAASDFKALTEIQEALDAI
jgi:tetratricopeptide (TPR) repeat protein